MKNIVIFEDNNLAKLLADEISGDPNNLDSLTKENLAKVEELFSVSMIIPHKEEQKIHSLKGLEWCVNLRQLHLVDHHISDLTPLYDLNRLETINLRKNDITSIYPLSGKETIRTLVVGQNKISDVTPAETMTEIKSLYVQENPLVNDSLLFVNKLAYLKDFCFWETQGKYIEEINQYRSTIRLSYERDAS